MPYMLDITLDASTIGVDSGTEHITVENVAKVTGGRVKLPKDKTPKAGSTAPVRVRRSF
jgi:hypothetical protein